MPDGVLPEQANLRLEQATMMLGVRIGVCSDVHGRHDRLLAVLGAMAAAGVDERWCLGDLVGGEPVTAELVGAACQLDLLIAGNHDAWVLGPDRVVARGRDVFRLSSRAKASRHGIDCWHGSPRHPLLGFLTEASAAKVLPDRPVGSLGLVGHTHEPALFAYDGAATRAVRPVPGESYDWLATGACMANPGAVCGNPATRRAGGSSSTLTPVCCGGTARSSSPEKLPLPACEPRRSHRRVTRVVTGIRHRDQPCFQGDNDTVGAHILFPNPLHQFPPSGRHAAAGQRARDNHFKP